MQGQPVTPGNRSKGIYVDVPLPLGLYQVQKLKRRIADIPDALRTEALSLGRFYKGRDALEQMNSLGLHGLRYWFVSQVVRNYMRAQGAPTGKGYRTLEVGCNVGWTSILANIECEDLDVFALDIDESLVRLGQILEKTVGSIGVRWIVGNGMQLNKQLEGENFDLVLLCEILEHFGSTSEQKNLLAQAVNVCRPGGMVIVSVPFEDRIRTPDHLTEFNAAMLTDLVQPFAKNIVWLAEERMRYILDKHFFLMFTPKTEVTELEL